uniref:Uncharacterized protein n=1 Tax=Accipiter nisus TaxID=211598 RepID=A0A8B9N9F6_9AVES
MQQEGEGMLEGAQLPVLISCSDTKIKQWPCLQGRSYSTKDPQAQRLTNCSLA